MNDQSSPHAGEPDPAGRPTRRFRDPQYRPLCPSLAEIRQHIDAIDTEIIALLARRAAYVKDAARFKRDAYQVSAPARQAEVFAKARARAQALSSGFAALPDVADATYRAMVAAFIAAEQSYFNDMDIIADGDAP